MENTTGGNCQSESSVGGNTTPSTFAPAPPEEFSLTLETLERTFAQVRANYEGRPVKGIVSRY
ncbi:MAG TPA: hypothetical protein VI756_00055 [Blastocatellia bacterium]